MIAYMYAKRIHEMHELAEEQRRALSDWRIAFIQYHGWDPLHPDLMGRQ